MFGEIKKIIVALVKYPLDIMHDDFNSTLH